MKSVMKELAEQLIKANEKTVEVLAIIKELEERVVVEIIKYEELSDKPDA